MGGRDAHKGFPFNLKFSKAFNHKISIYGDKATLAAAIAGQNAVNANFNGFFCKWRATQDKTENTYVIEIAL